jgi:predicted nuclease of restriction endonuclease-like RecB superfamily
VLLGRSGEVQSTGARLSVVEKLGIYTTTYDQAKHMQSLAAILERMCNLQESEQWQSGDTVKA